MFGFLKGNIAILIDNYDYNFGDFITGKVKLDLKKDFFANSISIRLIGEKKIITYIGNTKNKVKQRIFDFKLPLDGKKQYKKDDCPYEYDFKIAIPSEIYKNKFEENLGEIKKTVSIVKEKKTPIKWYLLAKLDVAKSLFDISEKIQINLKK